MASNLGFSDLFNLNQPFSPTLAKADYTPGMVNIAPLPTPAGGAAPGFASTANGIGGLAGAAMPSPGGLPTLGVSGRGGIPGIGGPSIPMPGVQDIGGLPILGMQGGQGPSAVPGPQAMPMPQQGPGQGLPPIPSGAMGVPQSQAPNTAMQAPNTAMQVPNVGVIPQGQAQAQMPQQAPGAPTGLNMALGGAQQVANARQQERQKSDQLAAALMARAPQGGVSAPNSALDTLLQRYGYALPGLLR